MEIIKTTYEEYWGYYWRITSRHKIPGIFQYDRDLVDFIEKECALNPGASILDLGCGGGDQAKIFAQKGYHVTGIDKVQSLINFAVEAFEHEGLHGEFHTADMRDIEYRDEFDLCVILSGTFGLFREEENEELLRKIYLTLKADGQVFIDYLPLESISSLVRKRSWNYIEDGFSLREEWFDVPTSTYRTRNMNIMLDGRIIEDIDNTGYGANEIIRCYGHREIEILAERCGFTVKDHLSRKQLEQPDYVPDDGEPRGMLLLVKTF